jgi:hypothetical protein
MGRIESPFLAAELPIDVSFHSLSTALIGGHVGVSHPLCRLGRTLVHGADQSRCGGRRTGEEY